MAATSSSDSFTKPTFNILLLGRTVAGKETFANALSNYLKIHDFDYAKSNDLYHITPSQLTFPGHIDYPLVTESGGGPQVIMCYPFEFVSRSICLIDPPGMDYAENSELNVENFDSAINYLGHHSFAIHAIFVLVNSSNTVKSSSFCAYLHQLFSRLPQNAHNNVIFCFTFSYSSYFADSIDSLKLILQKEPKENTFGKNFYINIEAYRYLLQNREFIIQDNVQVELQRRIWASSAIETSTLFSTIMYLPAFCFMPTKLELHCDNVEVDNVDEEALPSQAMIEEKKTSKVISEAFEQNKKELLVTDLDVPMVVEEEKEDTSLLPEYNILLLGETGAGKSTTINAFANYAQYSSFDEAAANEFVQLIPSQFMLPNPDTDEPMVLTSGDQDVNERLGEGNSSTKDPMSYLFRFGGGTIRIIDTPGMGDTAGAEVDKQNFEKILHYLHCFENLHGICILMKANETRRTASFRYCINQLLTHLHKSACRNIVFCFTFSRNSHYGPGEGFTTLRAFLAKELAEVELVLKTGINSYFVDNEAYRFLVAKKCGYPFRPQQENSYRESWDMSAEQTNRMMQYILNLEPHSLVETCSLYAARKLILELAEPMVKLQVNINANMERFKEERKRIMASSETRDELARGVRIEAEDIEMRHLSNPATVCTENKCIEVIQAGEKREINYKTRCHENCFLTDVKTNAIGHPSIKNCQAMNCGQSENCNKCGCHWQKHMHQTFEYVRVKRTIVDVVKKGELENTENWIQQRKEASIVVRQTLKEYKEEFEIIQVMCAKFAYILANNSNTAHCRFIEPYLDLLIDEEKQKVTFVPNYPRLTFNTLVTMKETHETKVRELTKAIANQTHPEVTIEQIDEYREQLLQLKHSGPQIRQMLKIVDSGKQKGQQVKLTERRALDFTKHASSAMSFVASMPSKAFSSIKSGFKKMFGF